MSWEYLSLFVQDIVNSSLKKIEDRVLPSGKKKKDYPGLMQGLFCRCVSVPTDGSNMGIHGIYLVSTSIMLCRSEILKQKDGFLFFHVITDMNNCLISSSKGSFQLKGEYLDDHRPIQKITSDGI